MPVQHKMKLPRLFRRRTILLPTLAGWVVILAVLTLGAGYGFRNMADFLTVNDPAGADYLVIEAWMNKQELDQGIDYMKTSRYQKVLLVGGPIDDDFYGVDTNYADRATTYFLSRGVPENMVATIRVPGVARNRTYFNAVKVKKWFQEQEIVIPKIDVFSSGVHTRRSRYLYQKAFGDRVDVGVIHSNPSGLDTGRWWQSSATGKRVAVEFANWVLTRCCLKLEETDDVLQVKTPE